MIDLIVPTIPGREDSLVRCVDSYVGLAESRVRPIVIRDSETCGGGWREGLESSTAEYVLLACDDQEALSEGWDVRAHERAEKGLIPCPRVFLPNGAIESNGGDMKRLLHTDRRPRRDGSPVDYTTIPFVSREQVDAIGMLEVHYASDVWVSYRGRQLGYETVLCHGFDVRHWRLEHGRGAGMTETERDAMDVATVMEELERVKPEEAV